jgi:two-component system, LuxR family, response regulator FixJ
MLDAVKLSGDIYVVDDDPSVRDALMTALRAEGYNVEGFADAKTFMSATRTKTAAAVVLDVMLPDKSGLDVLKLLKEARHAAPVLVITGHGDIPMAVEAIKLGAYDFVEKPISVDLLLNMLRSAIKTQASDETAGSDGFSQLGGDVLTPREREVLREIASGASSKEAGRILGISPRTVEVHRARIMDKLGARNAADLMRIIFSHN